MKYILTLMAMVVSFNASAAVKVEKLNTKVTEKALYIQQKEIPTFNILLTFNAGTIYEGENPHGIANLMGSMLRQGTTKQTAQDIQRRLDGLGSHMEVYSSRNRFYIEVTALQENAEMTLRILRDILKNANFPEKELKILKGSISQAIRQEQESPMVLAMYKARKEFYGKDTVKAYISNLGTIESIDAISRKHLDYFYKNYITRQNMAVNVVSSLDKEKVEELVDTYLIGMNDGKRKELSEIIPEGETNRAIVEKDLPQTTVMLYKGAIARDSDDYYKSVLFNYVLGAGGFSSRLMEEIREKRGLTYGVRSSLEYDLPYQGLFTVSLQTSNKNAYKTEKLIRKELKKIAETGITQEELDNAKNFLVGSFPIRIRTSDKLLSFLTIMQEFDLSEDYVNAWAVNIDKVTLEEVNQFAKDFVADQTSISRVFVGGV